MRLTSGQARERLTAARVARLATVSAAGQPHLVPVTFAIDTNTDAGTVYIAIDHKPKTTTQLKRLANIAANPGVTLLADHYDDDWTQLWWSRADGQAAVLAPGPDTRAPVVLLAARYPQYRDTPPTGPVIAITVTAWSGWSYT
jgi:PPOX class probable F420-dependent enzyme